MPTVEVDARAIEELGKNIEQAKRAMLDQLAERGYQLLHKEVPYQTGNLQQGVAPPDVDYDAMTAGLTVSARSAAVGSRSAAVFDKDGKLKKTVTLRPSPAFNYAEAIARGRAKISPKNGKALLIPVASTPSRGGYLVAGGQIFVVRRSAAAVAPNPFDERAAIALENEAVKIGESVLNKFV